MGDRQIVLLPIETPVGKYCWQGENPCEYFDNQGGHGTCTIPGMFVRDESKNSYYVLKDEKCLNAHTAENHMSEVFSRHVWLLGCHTNRPPQRVVGVRWKHQY